jgi:hypothetical protein
MSVDRSKADVATAPDQVRTAVEVKARTWEVAFKIGALALSFSRS